MLKCIIKKRRLLWFEHVEQKEGERQSIAALQGQVEGKRREQKEAKADLDGQCQKRPGGEKQDWRGDQKLRGLEESCKSLIISSLMEERKEEEVLETHNTKRIQCII